MSKTHSEARSPVRSLTTPELAAYRAELDRLAASFDELSTTLRCLPGNSVAIPELRLAMSRAGWILTRLLHHGAVSAPQRRPPWLSWRTPGHARPRFVSLRGRPFHSSWSPRCTVFGLVQQLRAGPQAVDVSTPRRPREDDGAAFVRRHVWIEAICGWLGQRCTPRLQVVVPPVHVALEAEGLQTHVAVVLDWVADATQRHLLFLELARDSASACRQLSADLQSELRAGPLAQWPSALSTHDALDDLRRAIADGTAADVGAATELAERMEHYIATAGVPDPGEMLPGLLSPKN